MPKRKRRSNYTRLPYKKRRGIKKRSTLRHAKTVFHTKASKAVIRGSSVLPEVLITRLPYASLLTRSATTTQVDHYTFRTSMFDPDLTGGGFFPTGREELNTLYNRYICYGLSYNIQLVNMSATVPARVCIVGNNEDTTWTTFQEAASQPNASKTIILGVMTGGNNVIRQSGYLSTAGTNGVSKSTVTNDDLYRSLFSASPDRMGYLQILHSNMDGSATTDVHMTVNIKLYVKCFELKPLRQTS